jgi:hypothetical protein
MIYPFIYVMNLNDFIDKFYGILIFLNIKDTVIIRNMFNIFEIMCFIIFMLNSIFLIIIFRKCNSLRLMEFELFCLFDAILMGSLSNPNFIKMHGYALLNLHLREYFYDIMLLINIFYYSTATLLLYYYDNISINLCFLQKMKIYHYYHYY